jgi:hypothetical protein
MRGVSVAILACPLILSGCRSIFSCTYEERSINASGAVVENGAEIVRAGLVVGALRGSLEWKYLDPTISGTLKGHVSSIAFIRSGDPASVPLSIPVDPPSSPLISSGSLMQRPGEVSPDLGGVYEVVAANLGVLEITTDLPSRPLVSVPLTVTRKQDWLRPNNCY